MSVADPGERTEAPTIIGVTAGAEILLFLPCFLLWQLWSVVFLHLMSVSNTSLCCFGVYVFYVRYCMFLEAVLFCYEC